MKRNGKYLLLPSMVWLAVFFVIPMLIVVAVSFASRTAYGQIVFGWTFQNYSRFLDPLYISIFGRTIFIAVVTTVCTILMGYPLAYCIALLPRHLRQGDHPPQPGRAEYDSDETGSYFPADSVPV